MQHTPIIANVIVMQAIVTKENQANCRLFCVVHFASVISREISQASASTVRAHFGCIFKATADCAT
jgi:hypothetical protein